MLMLAVSGIVALSWTAVADMPLPLRVKLKLLGAEPLCCMLAELLLFDADASKFIAAVWLALPFCSIARVLLLLLFPLKLVTKLVPDMPLGGTPMKAV